jgi:hypothetical protein
MQLDKAASNVTIIAKEVPLLNCDSSHIVLFIDQNVLKPKKPTSNLHKKFEFFFQYYLV